MERDIISDIYDAAKPAIFNSREAVPEAFLEYASGITTWSRALNFAEPIKGHYDIKGLRFLDFPDGTDMFLVRHNGTGIPWDTVKQDTDFADVLLNAVKLTTSKPLLTDEIAEKNFNKDRKWAEQEGGFLKEICPGYYFCHYDDYSGSMRNSLGLRMETPLKEYEFILGLQYIGVIDGIEHFAYKATDWATKYITDYGIFDLNGKPKYSIGVFYGQDDVTINSVVKEWKENIKERNCKSRETRCKPVHL